MSLADDLRAALPIRPDFPIGGIQFIDILPLLGDAPKLFGRIIDELCSDDLVGSADGVITVESRGILFAAPVAVRLGKPLIIVRKAGKTPPPVLTTQSKSEYDAPLLELQQGRVAAGFKYVLIDDILATGGTALAATELVRQAGGEVRGALFLGALPKLGGAERLAPMQCRSLVDYDFS